MHDRAAVCPWRVAGQWNSPVSRTVVWAGHDSGRGEETYRGRGVGAREKREGAASSVAKTGKTKKEKEKEHGSSGHGKLSFVVNEIQALNRKAL